jgi:exodeoxyribonuclease VII small subunit
MEEKVINFEEELNRLRQIVNDIQNKDISIDESLSLYEEGQKIIATLSKELEKAESKVEKVIKVGK